MADAWIGIGVCELELGHNTEAVKYLEKGVLLDQDNISYLCLLANNYFLLGDHEQAKATYERAIEADPEDEETWLEFAEALVSMQDYDHAVEILGKGLGTIKAKSNLLATMAAVLFLSGKHGEGNFCLEEALNAGASSFEPLLSRFPKLQKNAAFLEAMDKLIL